MGDSEHPIDHERQFDPPRFCQLCGNRLSQAVADGQLRPVCPACGFVYFDDPKVATGAIVERHNKVLLIKRAIPPGLGKWTFPGGYMNRGETTVDATKREVKEETGLVIRVEDLLGIYSFPGRPVVIIVYRATIQEGALRINAECQDGHFFYRAEIPWDQLAFDSTHLALNDWIKSP